MKTHYQFSTLLSIFISVVLLSGCENELSSKLKLKNQILSLEKNTNHSLFTERLPWMPSNLRLIYVGYSKDTKTALFASKIGIIEAADHASIRRHSTHPDSTNYLSVSFFEKVVHPVATDFKCIHWDNVSYGSGTANITTFKLLDWEILKFTVPLIQEENAPSVLMSSASRPPLEKPRTQSAWVPMR